MGLTSCRVTGDCNHEPHLPRGDYASGSPFGGSCYVDGFATTIAAWRSR
jgi:hypothetical protein